MNNITNHASPPRPAVLSPPLSPKKYKSEDYRYTEKQEAKVSTPSPKTPRIYRVRQTEKSHAILMPSSPNSPQKVPRSRPRAETCLTESRNVNNVSCRRTLSADDVHLHVESHCTDSTHYSSFKRLLQRMTMKGSPQCDGTDDGEGSSVASSASSDVNDREDLEPETPYTDYYRLDPISLSPGYTPCPKRRWRAKDPNTTAELTSPEHSPFPNIGPYPIGVTTPLTEASPAVDAFLFTPCKRRVTSLSALPSGYRGSPLRHSQWLSRGGSSPQVQTPSRMADRFIPARRSPNSSTESFFTSKPTSALTDPERLHRRASGTPNPFARQLRRSSRLTNQLRALRQSQNRPNVRNNSFTASRPSVTTPRQISDGAIWQVGGSAVAGDSVVGISTGQGGLLGSGTNAPLYTSKFLQKADPESELETYERRLAAAFDIDQSCRILGATNASDALASTSRGCTPDPSVAGGTAFGQDGLWKAFLDAPQLRDDFYCSLLAYSATAKCLAVGLGNFVHLWSEEKGVDTPERVNNLSNSHVTTLAFSSAAGGQAILAVGRADGRISLWSLFDEEPRFEASQPSPIACVSFRPSVVKRGSIKAPEIQVPTEELLIGDEAGHIYLYSVEWPPEQSIHAVRFHGGMTLLARITVHTQQVCGLSWSSDGEYFATGGNDNACFLFETKKLLCISPTPEMTAQVNVEIGADGERRWTVVPGHGNVLSIPAGREKHKWILNAAVKAIAFCPWQRGLVAIGGGSNDRCIHFYHTISGAGLATIDCAAQVTSLIWSNTRREIAATFGFAQPDHPFRIAVFSWPACEQVVAIPWYDESRALFAIGYPGSPNTGQRDTDGADRLGRDKDGCIVVAASDAAIRFHEVWSEEKRRSKRRMGILGGSDILESFHGIEKEGPEVR
ncbi:WD40 repeat-like protein [Pseudovirgaria hyperparasitica]|uniref:WD40 repeat-like protein n=1 Tax=Pseudovirgaria hyperparasitica TaxID=470096 RepID=A0A6A6WII4_9PEZI|nr:WD40 repeat-like protein [Pseudovirgaria hyperparasitica]KAF2762079.1 WD40 repeat-like protein [Pseudovirgaria hyperparasitica]